MRGDEPFHVRALLRDAPMSGGADVERFFATHPVEASDRSLRQALENIDMCVEMRTLQAQNFAQWLGSEAGSK